MVKCRQTCSLFNINQFFFIFLLQKRLEKDFQLEETLEEGRFLRLEETLEEIFLRLEEIFLHL